MRIIGITGGVGAGKTQLLAYIEANYSCRVIYADQAAHMVKEPGAACYESLVALLGREVLTESGAIDRARMAQKIFGDGELLLAVNAIVHPAVKEYILGEIAAEKAAGVLDYFFIEAALLIEEHYDKICDELWYVYADQAVRRERLMSSRGYTPQKAAAIMASQLTEGEFRMHCQVVIDNSGSLEAAYRQIDEQLGGSRRGLE